ncbi:MAG: bifunctional sugar phosphate isomerase/epimerase/4-hydroxyphenylpyruvate dioxygenase family protein [Paracoccus sp. (in: a-proteobacteria)]|uniref:bifunctional sugar phosphate isomerase/epimerase/4-hydroxyphenylpyruvate dioxygenase family protein n=1 Tax=unclassified Paracoccus (in: a-proteobacteria) TaxID=2688777 RepID=UPI000C5F1C36|nr:MULTISPECIES: sugar phosphate isomerase/epimerase and 4-hydroxyphenylpyruvate domain-containing protein [unclassified Paracoccus (in: a-proteobacteria)]MAN55253.1 3-keto-5-aminohexanoate cleavage protein [Paracoccus sp. (in: a-proteobacteria)]MBA47871.1 3-keto-5-aminohexanoate cleavage protein [Paracoccus sp. (in: a-proteobacteria)]|tara:strand:+ start:5140 stop:7026 length:1887 start_codon:yes stop_codon:yes gene_type:complete
MKTGIATVSIAGNLREKLAAIAAAGFDGLEIFEQDFLQDAANPREVGRMIRDHGLEVMLYQPFRDFEGLPATLRARAFDRARHKFDLMAELGAELMLICSSVHPQAMGGIDRAADDLAELAEIATRRGLRIGYEALAWGRHVNDHRDAWEIVRRADHPALGLILDSFHTLGRRIDPDTIRRIPGDRIFFVQLADAPMIDMDLLYWSRHFRTMPGEGDLPVVDFMRAVTATGYGGPLSLEIFNDQFRGGSPEGIARDGHRSLIWLMDQVRRAEPALHVDLPPIPENLGVEGVEFIEFASDAAEAPALEAALTRMGFHREGVHRNKRVTVWRQGGIRIVVNTEETGFAHSFFLNHGTGVCDIGLRVEDAQATVVRAAALDARLFHQPPGPGELDIPAIRGVGGSVLHFIDAKSGLDDVWRIEFQATGDSATDFGLIRVDHLAETMNYEDMLSWTLFYTAIFDMDRRPMIDVADPDGLVRSQAIASRDGATRITLNGAQSHRTLAGGFLADSMGSAVQHIALASRDILASARAMAGAGFQPLEIPENYYDDLQARYGLDDDRIARLRRWNILYEAEGEAEFYQFYGRPLTGGLFFEIVERRGGYDGYGAANAPFRIAALKRLLRAKDMPRA